MSRAEAPSVLRRRLLQDLYGPRAHEVGDRIDALLERRRRATGDGGAASLWTQDDVWLIAYGDQFHHGDRPPLQVLDAVLDDELASVVNGVHILPFYPWSSDDGFSVRDYRQVDPALGTWDDVAKLAKGRRFMTDAVINHASAQGWWFERFLAGEEPWTRYFRTEQPGTDVSLVVRPRTHALLTAFETAAGPRSVWTTFSADQVDLDYREPDVLLDVMDILLDYIDHGADVIRLDAIGFLWKDPERSSIHLPETHAAIQIMRSCIDEVRPGSMLISETNVPHRENISYLNDDPPEVHAVYQFPLAPLVADAVLNGRAETLATWADGIDEATGPGHTFLNFLASHDGIGVRPAEGLLDDDAIDGLVAACRRVGGQVSMRSLADGSTSPYELNTTWFSLMGDGVDRETALARHLAAHAIMLALPGIAALYVHSLFGSTNDLDGLAATGRARSINRARFDAAELGARLADPDDPARRTLDALETMVVRRRSLPAFHPDAACSASVPTPGVVAIERRLGAHIGRCIVNLTPTTVTMPDETLGPVELAPYGVDWQHTPING